MVWQLPKREPLKSREGPGAGSQIDMSSLEEVRCPSCARLVQKRSLRRHMREVHTRPSQHRCRDCQAEFANGPNLDRHVLACKVRQRRKEAGGVVSAGLARVRRVHRRSARYTEEQPSEVLAPALALSIPEDLFLDCLEWGSWTFWKSRHRPLLKKPHQQRLSFQQRPALVSMRRRGSRAEERSRK